MKVSRIYSILNSVAIAGMALSASALSAKERPVSIQEQMLFNFEALDSIATSAIDSLLTQHQDAQGNVQGTTPLDFSVRAVCINSIYMEWYDSYKQAMSTFSTQNPGQLNISQVQNVALANDRSVQASLDNDAYNAGVRGRDGRSIYDVVRSQISTNRSQGTSIWPAGTLGMTLYDARLNEYSGNLASCLGQGIVDSSRSKLEEVYESGNESISYGAVNGFSEILASSRPCSQSEFCISGTGYSMVRPSVISRQTTYRRFMREKGYTGSF